MYRTLFCRELCNAATEIKYYLKKNRMAARATPLGTTHSCTCSGNGNANGNVSHNDAMEGGEIDSEAEALKRVELMHGQPTSIVCLTDEGTEFEDWKDVEVKDVDKYPSSENSSGGIPCRCYVNPDGSIDCRPTPPTPCNSASSSTVKPLDMSEQYSRSYVSPAASCRVDEGDEILTTNPRRMSPFICTKIHGLDLYGRGGSNNSTVKSRRNRHKHIRNDLCSRKLHSSSVLPNAEVTNYLRREGLDRNKYINQQAEPMITQRAVQVTNVRNEPIAVTPVCTQQSIQSKYHSNHNGICGYNGSKIERPQVAACENNKCCHGLESSDPSTSMNLNQETKNNFLLNKQIENKTLLPTAALFDQRQQQRAPHRDYYQNSNFTCDVTVELNPQLIRSASSSAHNLLPLPTLLPFVATPTYIPANNKRVLGNNTYYLTQSPPNPSTLNDSCKYTSVLDTYSSFTSASSYETDSTLSPRNEYSNSSSPLDTVLSSDQILRYQQMAANELSALSQRLNDVNIQQTIFNDDLDYYIGDGNFNLPHAEVENTCNARDIQQSKRMRNDGTDKRAIVQPEYSLDGSATDVFHGNSSISLCRGGCNGSSSVFHSECNADVVASEKTPSLYSNTSNDQGNSVQSKVRDMAQDRNFANDGMVCSRGLHCEALEEMEVQSCGSIDLMDLLETIECLNDTVTATDNNVTNN